jgi:hypothetical protein
MNRLGYAATAAAMALLIYGGSFVFTSLTQQDLYDCSDFTYQEDAQAVYDQDTTDPYGLDGPPGLASEGTPGVACEDLPSRGTDSSQAGARCDNFVSLAGYRSQWEAQQYFYFNATPEEKAYLDTDGDGFACDGWSTGSDTLGTVGGESGYYARDGNYYYW